LLLIVIEARWQTQTSCLYVL